MSSTAPVSSLVEHHWLRRTLEEMLNPTFPITVHYISGHRVRIEMDEGDSQALSTEIMEIDREEAFSDGRSEGYDEGREEGYDFGFEEGRAEGIEEGEKAGAAEVIQSLLDMINGGASAGQVVLAVKDSAALMGLA